MPATRVRISPGGTSFELEPGIHLDPWRGGPDQLVFLTRFHREFLSDDHAAWDASAALRVRARTPSTGDATEFVVNILDRFKWAVMIAIGSKMVVREGDTVLRSATRHLHAVLRRESIGALPEAGPKPIGWIESRALKGLYAEENTLETIRARLAGFAQASLAADDLAPAMWAFGRSCVASTPRDVLLEAAIGLERLLVSGPGETTYRFRLHGASILADEMNAFKELGQIYALRSRAAHGGSPRVKGGQSEKKGERPVHSLAPRARFLLAKVIQAVVLMINNADLLVGDRGVAAAIEDLVRHRASGV